MSSAYRLSVAALAAAGVMAAAAAVAFAAGAHVAGLVFLVLMLACAMAGFWCAVRFRNRAVAAARAARQRQSAPRGGVNGGRS